MGNMGIVLDYFLIKRTQRCKPKKRKKEKWKLLLEIKKENYLNTVPTWGPPVPNINFINQLKNVSYRKFSRMATYMNLLLNSPFHSFHRAFVSLFTTLPILQTLVPSQSYFHPYCSLSRSGFFMLVFTLSQSFPAFCISLPRPSSQSLTLAQLPLLLYFYTLSHLSP